MFVVLLVVLGIVHRASGLEDGFVHEKMLAVQHSKGALMQVGRKHNHRRQLNKLFKNGSSAQTATL